MFGSWNSYVQRPASRRAPYRARNHVDTIAAIRTWAEQDNGTAPSRADWAGWHDAPHLIDALTGLGA
jgi:hypothetical protein